ncbi:TPA: hypothetical protein ACF2DE_002827 [Clostridium perfringens]
MEYHIDLRTNELVKGNPSNYLAPELFYEYCFGIEGIIIEKWRVGDDRYLDFAYSIDEDINIINKSRNAQFEINNIDPECVTLSRYTVPKSVFDEVIKDYVYNLK